jgi:hypothetical protein
MTKFEYCTVEINPVTDNLQNELNEYGLQCWELVNVGVVQRPVKTLGLQPIQQMIMFLVLIFKREL